MKWQIWKRERHPKTIVLAPDAPFSLEWKWPYKPLEVNHNVIHSPYPRPTVIIIWAITKDGRRWQLSPYYCRGGSYHAMDLPGIQDNDPYVRLEIDVHYDNLSGRKYDASNRTNNRTFECRNFHYRIRARRYRQGEILMVLIEARPLRVKFDHDHRNNYFINPEKIIRASFNDAFKEAENWINVKLIDDTEWMIRREIFNQMVISTDRKGN